MVNLKWRVKGIIEFLRFQKEVLIARALARVPYKGGSGRLCFIAGCGRSGTSLLGRMLSMHREIAYIDEPRNYWIAINRHSDIWGYCSDDDERLSLFLEMDSESEKVRFSNLFYRYRDSSGCSILVEKSPENVFRIPWLAQLADNAKIIHIVRNGNDVVRSILGESGRIIPYGFQDMDNWYGKRDKKKKLLTTSARYLEIDDSIIDACKTYVDWAALEWICSLMSLSRNWKYIPSENQIMIKYENILDSPWDTYKELMLFLGVDFDDALHQQIERYVNPRKGEKPPVDLPNPLKSIFERELKNAGYFQSR